MNKAKNIFLTPSQFTLTLVSAMIGTAILSLPNSVIKVAKQDGWMSCLVGSFYPIYIVVIANYICNKFPKDNILVLSKKCFGNLTGTILNFIFISFLLFVGTASASGFSNVFSVYAIRYLKSYQILSATLLVVAYIAYKGIKPLGKLCEIIFYTTLIILLIPIPALKQGSVLNIMPIFSSGLTNIVKASKETAFAYTGIELIFLIYPFLQNNKRILKYGITCTAIVVFIYTYVTFTTIFYLGIETSPKYIWPVITLSESIKIPVINSFRYIFISLWALVMFRCISVYYFAVSYSLNVVIKKIPPTTFVLLLYPVFLYISLRYGNPTTRSNYVDKLTPLYIIFNIIYVTAVAFFIHFKKVVR